MRCLLVLCPLVVMSAQVAISPQNPSVVSGKTITLSSNTPVTWSLNGVGSLSNVTSTSATYTAPMGIAAKNQMLGCPVGPNDSIFNTRIDSLPVDSMSNTWIGGATTNPTHFEVDNWGISIADANTPTRTLRTYYSDATVPNFVMPTPGPNLKRQGGNYVGIFANPNRPDHHVMTVRHTDCSFYETYDDYLDGYTRTCGDGSPGCNVQSAVIYSSTSYDVPGPDGGTNAGGLPLAPTIWQLSEIERGHINHATTFTTNYASIAAGLITWPASGTAGGCDVTSCPGAMPMGTRLRLKSSFNQAAVCNSGIAAQDAACNTMLTALKQYGMILSDTGIANSVQLLSEVTEDRTVSAAVEQLIGAQIAFTNFEAVDESSLEVSPTSYQVCPLGSACLNGVNSYVAPSSQAMIIATTTGKTSVSTPIAIQPVGIGLGIPPIVGIATGNYSYQIPTWVNGAADQGVTWKLVSGVGSVTSSGVYTPPSATSAPGVTDTAILQGVANADSAATVALHLNVLQTAGDGTIRIDTGSPVSTIDANGNIWAADIGTEGDASAITSDYPHWNRTNPAATLAYETAQVGDDLGNTIIVPNGTYKLHMLFGMPDAGNCTVCTNWLTESWLWNQYTFAPYILEAQGIIQSSTFDFGALSSYLFQTPVDAYIPATVTNNLLQVYVRSQMSDLLPYNPPTSSKRTMLNGLEIISTGAAAAPSWTINTNGQSSIALGQTLQPFSLIITGGAPNDATWSIVSGPAGAVLSGSTLSLAANASPNSQPIVVQASDGTYSASVSIATPATVVHSSSATFGGLDTTTQGTWTGKYGADGFQIANDGSSSIPSYASLNFANATTYTWSYPTTNPQALQTSSGASSRIAATYYNPNATSFAVSVNLSDGNTHRVSLYLLDWGGNRSESIAITDAATNAVLDSESFSNFSSGQFATWNIKGNVIITVTSTTPGYNPIVSALFFGPAATASPSTSVATYSGLDTTTQGTWTGKYGSDGFQIANDSSSSLPSYASVNFTNSTTYTWAYPTTNPQALQTSSGASSRIAATYYNPNATSFAVSVNLTDGNTHRVSLYLLDWGGNRSESISITDAVTNAVLDSKSFSNFGSGQFATWNIKGNVIITVTSTTPGYNPIASALFFGPAATASSPTSVATYSGLDTTTQGTWTGKYGSDGFQIANDSSSSLPSYASVNFTNSSTYTWAYPTTNPQALQTSSGASSRIAATYYNPGATSFAISLNLTDGNTHPVALYLLDWGGNRSENIAITDAVTKAVLDSESFSNFGSGQFATWNIKGNVTITVTSTTPGYNPIASALFFK